jgi:hypothetical protein
MKKQKSDHEKTAETIAGILVNVLLRRLGADREATRAEKA